LGIQHQQQVTMNTPNSQFLEAALNYRNFGLSVIPIAKRGNGKQPAISWKPYQTTLPTEAELREWFARGDLNGLAIVFGQASGDVCCRDFDSKTTYQKWAMEQPDLAKTLPTVKTKRGYHVYFRTGAQINVKYVFEGEIHSRNSYCLAPPSLHPEGVNYEWIIPLTTENLLTIEKPIKVFSMEQDVTEGIEGIEVTDGTKGTEKIEGIKDDRSGIIKGGKLNQDEIAAIVKLVLPQNSHGNHVSLFNLARAVKGKEKHQGVTFTEDLLKEIFASWFKQNANLRPGQSHGDYYLEFLDAYEHAIYVPGQEPFIAAWNKAKQSTTPAIVKRHYADNEEMQLLVKLCCELQRLSGDRPFFLPFSKVQQQFNLENRVIAGRRLQDLQRRKIIKLENAHTATRARRYRYLLPLDVPPVGVNGLN